MEKNEDWMKILNKDYAKKKLIDAKLPRVHDIEAARRDRYRKKLLFKILNYNLLIDDPLFALKDSQGDLSSDLSALSLNSSLDNSLDDSNTSVASVDQPSQDDFDDDIRIYKEGIMLLKGGEENEGKDMISKAAHAGFQHAMFASAIIKFKEVKESDTAERMLESGSKAKDMIKEAVKYLVDSYYFFPLNLFVLGMLELYDIGGYGSVIKNESLQSWKINLAQVLLATEGTTLINGIKASNILSYSGSYNFGFVKPVNYMTVMGSEKGQENLKWMVQCVIYEFATQMIFEREKLFQAETLLENLYSDGFVDAKYLHAVALLTGAFDRLDRRGAEKAYGLLHDAVGPKHQEAKLIFGTLPFRKGFEFLRKDRIQDGRNCFNALKDCVYDNSLKKDFKEKASSLVANEYLSNSHIYAIYDEERAKSILKDGGNHFALKSLEKKLQKRKERSENALHDVLTTLRKVFRTFPRKDGSELYAELSPILEQIFWKLRSSGIIIQRSEFLSHILQQLKNISSVGKKDLLQLQHLSYILEEQINSHSHCSSQGEILQLLKLLIRENWNLFMG